MARYEVTSGGTPSHTRSRPRYMPYILHPLAFLTFAALCLGLIGVLEYIIRSKVLREDSTLSGPELFRRHQSAIAVNTLPYTGVLTVSTSSRYPHRLMIPRVPGSPAPPSPSARRLLQLYARADEKKENEKDKGQGQQTQTVIYRHQEIALNCPFIKSTITTNNVTMTTSYKVCPAKADFVTSVIVGPIPECVWNTESHLATMQDGEVWTASYKWSNCPDGASPVDAQQVDDKNPPPPPPPPITTPSTKDETKKPPPPPPSPVVVTSVDLVPITEEPAPKPSVIMVTPVQVTDAVAKPSEINVEVKPTTIMEVETKVVASTKKEDDGKDAVVMVTELNTIAKPSEIRVEVKPTTIMGVETKVVASTKKGDDGKDVVVMVTQLNSVAKSTAEVKETIMAPAGVSVITGPVEAVVKVITVKGADGKATTTTATVIGGDKGKADSSGEGHAAGSSESKITVVDSIGRVSVITAMPAPPDSKKQNDLVTLKNTIVSKGKTIVNIRTVSLADLPRTTIFETTVDGDGKTITNSRVMAAIASTWTSTPGSAPTPGVYPDKTPGILDSFKGMASTSFLVRMPAEFLGQFFLTVLAILLTMLWKPIDTDIKRMEPWYRMSRPLGATGEELTTMNLSFSNAHVAPILAGWKGYWLSAISSLIYSPLLTMVQLLSAATIFVAGYGACSVGDNDPNCVAVVTLRPTLLRAIQAILALIVVLVIVLGVLQWRRRKRILLIAEPFSIAGVAVLATEPTELQPILDIDSSSCSDAELRRRIKHVRFRLVERLQSDGSTSKIVLQATHCSPVGYDDANENDNGGYASVRYQGKMRTTRPLMLRWWVLIGFEALLLGMAMLVLVYRFVRGTRLERWMDSQTVGPRVLAMALGVIVRGFWEPIEREVQFLEPYRILSMRNQPSTRTVTADYAAPDIPIVMPIVLAITTNTILVPSLSIISLLIEVLVLLLASVPFSGSTTWIFWNFTTLGSAVILIIVFVAVGAILLHRWRTTGSERLRMPRMPYSVPVVLSYVVMSRMMREMGEIAAQGMSTGERWRKLRNGGKGYGFGWMRGVDGVTRLGVDEEEEDETTAGGYNGYAAVMKGAGGVYAKVPDGGAVEAGPGEQIQYLGYTEADGIQTQGYL